MGKLGDILGDEFEDQYENSVAKRRDAGRKIDTETLKRVCYSAIHEGGFKGDSPRFKFDAGELDHDVMLMEAPQNDIQKFRHKLGDDGVSLGMFHVGELMSCAFNDDMVELVDKIEEGEHYLVAGRYTEKTVMKDGSEETYKNISPVRGIVPIERAKQMADDYANTAAGSSMDEQAQQQQAEDKKEEESDIGGLDDLDDDEPSSGVDDSEIVKVFRSVADAKPAFLKKVKSGNEDALSKLTAVVNKNVDGDVSEERVADVFEAEIEPIDGRGDSDDEEEEDDGLSGLGDLDDDDGETTQESEPEEDTSSDGEDEADAEDWF